MREQTRRGTAIRTAAASPRLRRLLLAYLAFCINENCFWIAPLVWAYGVGGVGATSLMSVVELVPTALLAPVVASWCSRTTRPRALVAGYVVQMGTLVALGVALIAAPPVLVYVAASITCIANSATRPVHYSILPDIAETPEQLTASNAMSSGAEATAAFVGPLAAGLLMVPWGPGGVTLTAAALTGLAALLVLPLASGRRSEFAAAARSVGPTPWRALSREPMTRLFGALTFTEYVVTGAVDILLVVLALDLLGLPDSGPGLLNSAAGVGALVGTAATVLLVGMRRLSPALVLGALVAGVPIAFAGLSPTALAVVLVAIAGGGRLFFGVGSFTLLQRAVPDRMLVGVFGLLESMMSAGMALGAVLAPILIALVGTQSTFVVVGLLLPVAVLVALPGLRRADDRSEVAPEDVARLMTVPFLRLLTPLVVERLVREQTRTSVSPDTVLVREGDHGDAFYVVESGRLEVTQAGSVLRELGPGGWFGELALLHDVPRTASVRALEDVDVVILDRDTFLSAVTGAPRSVAAAHHEASARYADLRDDPETEA